MDEEEVILFERFIANPDEANSLFIRFACDQDVGLYGCAPLSVEMMERISFASPLVKISFVDSAGIYFSVEKFNPDATFWLYFGNSLETSIKIAMKYSKIVRGNLSSGKTESIGFTIHFVIDKWNELLNKRYNRAWSNTTLSAVVSEVASECGFEASNITKDSRNIETIIQPHWSNNTLLRNLQTRYSSVEHTDHFELCGKFSGGLMFKTPSELIADQVDDALAGEIPIMRLEGPAYKNEDRIEQKKKNKGYPTNFVNFAATDYYMDTVINGGGGVVAMSYDFDTGTFNKTLTTLSTQDSTQLADWSFIQKTHEVSRARINCGRSKYAKAEADALVSDVGFSIDPIQLSTEGSVGATVGDLVEIVIPSSTSLVEPYSIINSGFYLVVGVTHLIGLQQQQQFSTVITIARQGYDGKDLEGYAKTRKGKIS